MIGEELLPGEGVADAAEQQTAEFIDVTLLPVHRRERLDVGRLQLHQVSSVARNSACAAARPGSVFYDLREGALVGDRRGEVGVKCRRPFAADSVGRGRLGDECDVGVTICAVVSGRGRTAGLRWHIGGKDALAEAGVVFPKAPEGVDFGNGHPAVQVRADVVRLGRRGVST